MTDIFSTTSRVGFLSWIAALESPGKGTTQVGSNRNRNVCDAKKNPRVKDRRLCSASWNGFGCRQKRVTPKARRASMHTKRCCKNNQRSAGKILRFRFLRDRVSAT